MAYNPYYPNGWKNNEEGETPITAAALQNMEDGIVELDEAVSDLNSKISCKKIYKQETISSRSAMERFIYNYDVSQNGYEAIGVCFNQMTYTDEVWYTVSLAGSTVYVYIYALKTSSSARTLNFGITVTYIKA